MVLTFVIILEFGFDINKDCKEKIFKEIEERNTKLLDF